MNITNKDLKRRIIDISYRYKLSHLGSCLTAVDIIDEIYKKKQPDEKFVLSSGHAGLALYTVIEKYEGVDAEEIFNHHGVHPDRCGQCHIHCSSGSLGNGLPIAVGMALADRTKNVYCLISDGEIAEGSIWEALFTADYQKLTNLKVYLNFNAYGAYRLVPWKYLEIITEFDVELCDNDISDIGLPFLKGQDAHYYVLQEEDYNQAMEILK